MMLLGKITRDEWIKRYDKAKTREAATNALGAFDSFINAKHPGNSEAEIFEALIKADERERYVFVDRIVQYWKESKSPATIQMYFVFIKSWFKFNGIKLDNDDLRDFVKMPKKLKEKRQPLTREMIRTILEHCNELYRALYLVLACSGMRLNECLSIRVSDIDSTTNPPSIRIRAETTKTSEERITFITYEAWDALQKIIRDKKPMDRVFELTQYSVEQYMGRLRRKCGFGTKYSNGKNYHLNNHRFRSFAYTQLSTICGEDFAHMVVGHGGYLKQYFGKTNQELATEYAKAIPRLTINDERRLLDENERLKRKIESVEELKQKNIELEDRLKRLEMRRK
jgi:integrase